MNGSKGIGPIGKEGGTWVIKQLVPAEGWVATFRQADGARSTAKLACWALCTEVESGDQLVCGLVSADTWLDPAENADNFDGYEYLPEIPDRLE